MTTTLEKLARAVDDDLNRQACVQSGVYYRRADECGVADAEMCILVAEVARAVLTALVENVDEMVEAGAENFTAWSESGMHVTAEHIAARVFTAMINSILADPK